MNYINEKKVFLLSQGNIIADRIIGVRYDRDKKKGMNDIVKKYSKEIEARVMILNKNGVVIHDAYDVLNDEKLEDSEVKQSLKGKSIAKQHTFKEYGRVMYVSVPITLDNKVYGVVFISAGIEDVHTHIDEIMKYYHLLSFLCVIITGIISVIFAHVIADPIEALTEGINKMYQGNLKQKVEPVGNNEITKLAHAFNMMSTKLSQIDEQRKAFVGNVSHELRTPLSAMKLLSESMIHDKEADIKIYKEFFIDVVSEVDKLDQIIESLLYLVDLDKEKLELDYQVTYVNYLLEKLIRLLKPLADKKNIHIETVFIKKIQINLDQIKMQQALTNIISNAIKYTPEGGNIKISLYAEVDEIVIEIKDNGIGIPEESLPYVFERFYRVDKARNRNTGGTGLGLSIAHQIIGLHQGKIEVTSKVGEGTVFYVKLPQNIEINV